MTSAALTPTSSTSEERPSTPLELFVDLAFVVAVAQAADGLHHAFVHGAIAAPVAAFGLLFFSIWWAWMGFTWAASENDTDDLGYRLLVFVQMAGVLVLAAGVPDAFAGNFVTVVAGYGVMRLGLIAVWLRSALRQPRHAAMARRHAGGIGLLQVGWLAWLAIPESAAIAVLILLVAGELAVPVWAERDAEIRWHRGHIEERYGLFTIIVIGESVLAATVAVQVAIEASVTPGELVNLVGGGLLVLFAMWSLYFGHPTRDHHLGRPGVVFLWGYGHLLVFASAAAVGTGLATAADLTIGDTELGSITTSLTLAVALVIYVLAVSALQHHTFSAGTKRERLAVAAAVLAILAAATTPAPVLAAGAVLTALVATQHLTNRTDTAGATP